VPGYDRTVPPGHFLTGFSGNSANIRGPIFKAGELAMTTITWLGRDGGTTKGLSDHEILIPGLFSDRIQEVHMFGLHRVAELFERRLFPELY
jgi:phosphoheptose isomerase